MPLGKSDDDTEEGENAVQGSLPGLPKPLWSGGASAAQLLILCSLKTSYEPPQREHGSKSTALPLYLLLPCFYLIESMEEKKLLPFHAISGVALLSDAAVAQTGHALLLSHSLLSVVYIRVAQVQVPLRFFHT